MAADGRWLWAAHGKHPAAKDYFSIGSRFPLLAVFVEWIRMGYAPPAGGGERGDALISWRFWARGPGKGELACGLLRDSRDSFGRPYPLLILGNGRLPGWERHWEHLPEACHGVWLQLEDICASNSGTLGELEEKLGAMWQPEPCRERQGASVSSVPEAWEMPRREAQRMARHEMGSVTLGGHDSPDGDFLTQTLFLTKVLKDSAVTPPGAFFIGGTFGKPLLFFFRRPMRAADFRALWNHTSGGERG